MVPQKDGIIRFYIDYRKLNVVMVPDAYPKLRIDTRGRENFLDLTKGYWQIPLDSEAQKKIYLYNHFRLF